MKNKVLLLAVLSFSSVAFAQGRRENQSGVHGQFGYMFPKSEMKAGYMGKLGYNRVLGDKGFLGKAEVFYHTYEVGYIDNQILPYQKYGINVNGGYSYEGLYPVYLNAWGGVYGALENVNNGSKIDPKYSAIIPAKVSGFTFGITGSAEAEVVVARNISFILDYTQYYDFKSKFSKSNYGIFGGIKYYIN